MQGMERQKFEEGWKKAFDGAESTPPDRVWNSIEVDLAGQESATMKKKVAFYQRLAAAMLVFGLIAGSYGFYASSLRNEREVFNVQGSPSTKGSDNSGVQKENPVITTTDEKQEERKPQQHPVQQHNVQQQLALVEEPRAVGQAQPEQEPVGVKQEEEKEVIQKEEDHVTAVVSPLFQEIETPEAVVEPKRPKRQRENLWLAFGGSAGNYTPNTPTATTPTISQFSFSAKAPTLSFATTMVPKQQPKVGSSYSVGIGVGKRFGRFVVQTGVNLNKQQINYTSNYDAHTTSNTTVAAMADYIPQNSGLTFTNEYTVSSTMDVVSIPVQLGYMIVDRRLGWQLNGGVSNDFFLRNVLVDKSGQRSKFTQEAGSESPYRSVNWSALASTELSYRIGPHYRISLVPGARYSFNSILKNTKDNGRPVVLDVGFRFRYIFD
jgi:hypothetical protein